MDDKLALFLGPTNTLNTSSVRLSKSFIASVLGFGCLPEIAKSVICLIPVDVINEN
jgi:hypothetical protein